jgi:hypothetical protein
LRETKIFVTTVAASITHHRTSYGDQKGYLLNRVEAARFRAGFVKSVALKREDPATPLTLNREVVVASANA